MSSTSTVQRVRDYSRPEGTLAAPETIWSQAHLSPWADAKNAIEQFASTADDDAAPLGPVVVAAFREADRLREACAMAPSRVARTAMDGICFEWWNGESLTVLDINEDGTAEVREYFGDRLVAQHPYMLRG